MEFAQEARQRGAHEFTQKAKPYVFLHARLVEMELVAGERGHHEADTRRFAVGTARGAVAGRAHTEFAAGKVDENANIDISDPIVVPLPTAFALVRCASASTLEIGDDL